jgi:hypothetical protein
VVSATSRCTGWKICAGFKPAHQSGAEKSGAGDDRTRGDRASPHRGALLLVYRYRPNETLEITAPKIGAALPTMPPSGSTRHWQNLSQD